MLRTLEFTETDTGLVYTAVTSIPIGARLVDVLIESYSAWAAATAALDIGDSDGADSLAGAVDVSAQFTVNGKGSGGTDWGLGTTDTDGPYSAGGSGKYYPGGDQITAVLTATVPATATGISLVTLWIELPTTHRIASVV